MKNGSLKAVCTVARMFAQTLRAGRRVALLACAAGMTALAVSSASAQTQPVRVADASGSSLAVRMEFQSAPNEDVWPGNPRSRNLLPLYDAWEIGVASLHGQSPQRLASGQKIAYPQGQISGPAAVDADAELTLVQAGRKWVGGFEGGELSSFLGIAAGRLSMQVDGGSAGRVEVARNAYGLALGLGFKQYWTASTTFEARLGLFSGNPFYLLGKHDFASGLTDEAVTGEIGVIWPRGQTVALRVGIQGIRFVPQRRSAAVADESLTEVRLWGPFLGIQAALR